MLVACLSGGCLISKSSIPSSELIERIQPGQGVSSGIALVLGSGFSFPIIPTTREIVRNDLPWWLMCQSEEFKDLNPKDFGVDDKKEEFKDQIDEYSRQLWKQVCDRAGRTPESSKLRFELGGDGLPSNESISAAYMAILSPEISHGPNTPEQVRQYFAAIVKRIRNRLNPAHLYLASLIHANPSLIRTIFTTNFDPLLQRSLQLVNTEYYVSDRPDTMQHPDDDEEVGALHLVYAHGSIYRYLLLNDSGDIKKYAERNQELLQQYFSKHAVILVGYSGWPDAITLALQTVKLFSCNLYWCDRAKTLEESGLSPEAKKVIQSHNNAFYVPIAGADQLMIDMHTKLTGNALPEIFRDPIESAIDQIKRCDLHGMTASQTQGARTSGETASSESAEKIDLGDESERILERLEDANRRFKGELDEGGASVGATRARVQELLNEAQNLFFAKKYIEVIPKLTEILGLSKELTSEERARVLFRRGYSYGELGEKGDLTHGIADYTSVIDMPAAGADLKAWALYNRGVLYGQRGEPGNLALSISDYTSVIEMPGSLSDQKSWALVNRGFMLEQRGKEGDLALALSDYTSVIEMSDAPAEQKSLALYNRGLVYEGRGEKGDKELARADYTSVIEMSDAPPDQVAKAKAGLERV